MWPSATMSFGFRKLSGFLAPPPAELVSREPTSQQAALDRLREWRANTARAGGILPGGVRWQIRGLADFNGDGELNILDFVAFQNAFTSGDPAADCDGSGTLNILDFVCFQQQFTQGCA